MNQPSKTVTTYKIGFRCDKSGRLDTLWDSGEMVHISDYNKCVAEIERLRDDMARLLATSKTGGSDTCITCAAHVLVITEDLEPEIEQLRAALAQVTAAYDALLKRMGAVREAVGTDPHFEVAGEVERLSDDLKRSEHAYSVAVDQAMANGNAAQRLRLFLTDARESIGSYECRQTPEWCAEMDAYLSAETGNQS